MRIFKRIQKIKFSENYVFFGLICLIFIAGAYCLVRNPRKISTLENRSLAQFKHFTIKEFWNGSFQDNFEEAYADQFLFSEKIRTIYGQVISNIPTFNIDKLICSNQYIKASNDVSSGSMHFNCDRYLVNWPDRYTDSVEKVVSENIKKYNRLNGLTDAYYYVINNSTNIDFSANTKSIDYFSILSEKLTGKYHIAELRVDSYDEYKKYFYETDHHWNHAGSRQGFLDICKMLGIKNPAEPINSVTTEGYFYGSRARTARDFSNMEKFTAYLYDVPEHDVIINGKKAESYSKINTLLEPNREYPILTDFYVFYGSNSGEVVLDYHQPSKDNLLILTSSFGNPLKEIIAQYFNKTYAVDLRYYKKELGKDFVLSEYLKDNHIDKVLIVASSASFASQASNQGLEN